jgi:hypothetical protein
MSQKIFTLTAAITFAVLALNFQSSLAAEPQDDKNNPTAPGHGAGNFPPEQANNERAAEKNEDNCIKQFPHTPAQCIG